MLAHCLRVLLPHQNFFIRCHKGVQQNIYHFHSQFCDQLVHFQHIKLVTRVHTPTLSYAVQARINFCGLLRSNECLHFPSSEARKRVHLAKLERETLLHLIHAKERPLVATTAFCWHYSQPCPWLIFARKINFGSFLSAMRGF